MTNARINKNIKNYMDNNKKTNGKLQKAADEWAKTHKKSERDKIYDEKKNKRHFNVAV